jgi:outer membrane protein TolC
MKRAIHDLRFAIYATVVASLTLVDAVAQPTNATSSSSLTNAPPGAVQTTNDSVYPIDLPTALRLAGARNLDVQIARERLNEAQANKQSAVEQFFPWVAPGISYHRRDGVAQAVPSGVISDAHFQSYSPGVSLTAQIALGDAIYNSLAAKQLVKVSDQALETQRQDTVLQAAQGYFELVKGKELVDVVNEAIRVSQEYERQLHEAVLAGVAFKGDELRVRTQTEQYRLGLERALEQERVAGVNLAQVLHLDPRVILAPQDNALAPVVLFPTNAAMGSLVEEALRTRPELKQSQATIAAARETKNGAAYGPLIPTIGAQVFGGGLGGGPDSGPSNFGAEGDYLVGLSWRIGPGGLFDAGRVNASKARLVSAQLSDSKLQDIIISQVVAGLVHVDSTGAQIQLAERNLATATEMLRLTRERKQFGVGIVLEDIQAQQAVTQARSDYVSAVAENDKAQYVLRRAVGGSPETPPQK